MKKIAVYPGSFDPITLGHLDIINRAANIFEQVVIAVADNKLKKPLFDSDIRQKMILDEVTTLKLPNVEIKKCSGLLVDFVRANNANLIIRGLRAVSDFEYEFQMSFVNKNIAPGIETIFLPATENVHYISSSFVKEVAKLNGEISGLVTARVKEHIQAKFQHD